MSTSATVQEIIQKLKYGTGNEKIEAAIYARRNADKYFVGAIFGQDKESRILSKARSIEPFTEQDKLQIIQALTEVVSSGKDILACWYATVALVEFGLTDEERLDDLWKLANAVIEWLEGDAGGGDLTKVLVKITVQDETMRALSRLSNIPSVGEKVLECYEAKTVLGKVQAGLRNESLYAFGAIGNENYRELVRYNAEQGEGKNKKAGMAALELWGKGTYDEIKSRAEKESKKGGCFIATEIYHSAFAPEVLILKNYRDQYLARSIFGRTIISAYYLTSPSFVKFLRLSKLLRGFLKSFVIDPLIKRLRIRGY